MRLPVRARPFLAVAVLSCALLAGGAVRRVQDTCGPFTDVSALFCPYVLEAYYTGITAGTSPTTFSPDVPITRGQAAVFAAKGLNQALARGSRRAALGQWWIPRSLGLSIVRVDGPGFPVSDGTDVWVPLNGGFVTRIRASDGSGLGSWTGAQSAYASLSAMGRIFVTGFQIPGQLYMIDPSQAGGVATTVAGNLGADPGGIAFDGARIWTANSGGSVSIVTPGSSLPWAVTTVTTGFSSPSGIVFDGTNVWVCDLGLGSLLKLDAAGAILMTIPIGNFPGFPAYDGENIWVPDLSSNTVLVVRAATGAVIATLTGNGLASPVSAAFDGQRMLIAGDSLSLWNAADLSALGYVSHPSLGLVGACSDGIAFWVTFVNTSEIARF